MARLRALLLHATALMGAQAALVAQPAWRGATSPLPPRAAAQLCAAFTSDESGAGALSFEDYVDLYAAFSPKASFDTKARAAFRMYDFDGDGFLSEGDLTTLLATLTTPPGADEPMRPRR